jgi:hypothetical protein
MYLAVSSIYLQIRQLLIPLADTIIYKFLSLQSHPGLLAFFFEPRGPIADSGTLMEALCKQIG